MPSFSARDKRVKARVFCSAFGLVVVILKSQTILDGRILETVELRSAVVKVLLVEDSKFLRVSTERALKTAGYEVISSGDGEQALGLVDGKISILFRLTGPQSAFGELPWRARTPHEMAGFSRKWSTVYGTTSVHLNETRLAC